MKINEIQTDFPNWEEKATKAPANVIHRLMVNLKPVAKINTILYVEYIGEESKKEVFQNYFNKEKSNLESYLSVVYQTNRVLSSKQLDKTKLDWLKNLIEIYKPKHINFNLMNSSC